ncbi:glycosyltransferase family 4 protein [Kocuria coralli]|uniref:Glycosyltransferase family 4 protein n=1 Tax=Kocuria coralli TaxID=1461025 RepID=A0A5J5KZ96_9MICC|nr:glycosyltransferase family 1 protein [Kocuria coralli]KAA9395077.1 glycosyltransferase family 4 protein [Kocuria coralli]
MASGQAPTRLVIDARYVRVGRHDGISRYTAGLCLGLSRVLASRPGVNSPVHTGLHTGLHTAVGTDVDVELMISDERQLEHLPDFRWFLGPDPVSAGEVLTGRVLNRRGADVVFSPMQTMGAFNRRFGLILTLHDLIYYDHPAPPGDLPAPVRAGWRLFHKALWPQRMALNRADAVVTVSQTSADGIRERRLTDRPLFVVPNAADPAEVSAPDDALSRREDRTGKLVYMGSFMPYKDVETLVRAAALLPGYEFHLVSRISPQRRLELESAAPGARLVFHDGLSDDDYRTLLHEATALVHASRAEGYGLPLMEALCAGTPVVCTDIPIFHEVCRRAALYVPAGDAQGFAAAVRSLEEPRVARALITDGLDLARRSSWEQSALDLLAVVAQVASKIPSA